MLSLNELMESFDQQGINHPFGQSYCLVVTKQFTTELQQNIVDRINEKIASDTTYLNRLHSFYREDCELFESVNYYRT